MLCGKARGLRGLESSDAVVWNAPVATCLLELNELRRPNNLHHHPRQTVAPKTQDTKMTDGAGEKKLENDNGI